MHYLNDFLLNQRITWVVFNTIFSILDAYTTILDLADLVFIMFNFYLMQRLMQFISSGKF